MHTRGSALCRSCNRHPLSNTRDCAIPCIYTLKLKNRWTQLTLLPTFLTFSTRVHPCNIHTYIYIYTSIRDKITSIRSVVPPCSSSPSQRLNNLYFTVGWLFNQRLINGLPPYERFHDYSRTTTVVGR